MTDHDRSRGDTHLARLPLPDERRRPPPGTPINYVEQWPAVLLLNRMQTPMLAVADHGTIVFANPACRTMLGHLDTIVGQPLNHFLQGTAASASECVAALRHTTGKVTTWRRGPNDVIDVMVSSALVASRDDPILLISLTDLTEWLWTTRHETVHRHTRNPMGRHSPYRHRFPRQQ